MSGKELYILISDRCNFQCSHCLNSSGPKATRWKLSAPEIVDLVKTINESPEIQSVHFSGGEPSLFLSEIQTIQAGITRPIRYVMTSNGSFWRRPSDILSAIQIDEFILSYDRFRSKFIKLQNIVRLALELKSQGRKVQINLVLAGEEDTALIEQIPVDEIETLVNGAIRSGRFQPEQNYFRDDDSINRTCPSLRTAREQRGYDKVIFMPNQGFTPCCGPLVFDSRIDDANAFSSKFQEYSNNNLVRAMDSKSFYEQAKAIGYELKSEDFNSACEICTVLHGKVHGLPSLRVISRLSKKTFYPVVAKVPAVFERLVSQNARMRYLYTLEVSQLPAGGDLSGHQNLAEISLDSSTISDVLDFIESTYYKRFSEFLSPADVNAFKASADSYFSMDISASVISKGGKIVAVCLLSRDDSRSLIPKPLLHLGYSGYCRDSLEVSEVKVRLPQNFSQSGHESFSVS